MTNIVEFLLSFSATPNAGVAQFHVSIAFSGVAAAQNDHKRPTPASQPPCRPLASDSTRCARPARFKAVATPHAANPRLSGRHCKGSAADRLDDEQQTGSVTDFPVHVSHLPPDIVSVEGSHKSLVGSCSRGPAGGARANLLTLSRRRPRRRSHGRHHGAERARRRTRRISSACKALKASPCI